MPIQTRQMFNPQTEAARYQLELAQALQQRAMTPNLPPMGGPVQAQYGMGQGLVDLANALASSWNVRRANQAYERAQEAQKAEEEAKLREQQAAQQRALAAMAGGQHASDGYGPPTPEPGYAQTVALGQQAINAGVAPEIAKALMEARKPQEGYTLAPGARRMGPDNQMVAENPRLQAGADGVKVGQYNPGDYTSESWAVFARGGFKDPSVLKRAWAPPSPWIGMIGGGMTGIPNPRNPAGQVPLSSPDQERDAAAKAAAEKVAAEAAAKTAADQRVAVRDKQIVLNMYEEARNGLLSGLGQSETGPVAGRIPAVTAKQQIAEGAVAAMAPVLKQIFRVAGEGTFTDKDQELLLKMVPTRADREDARAAKITNIDRIIRAKLGIPDDVDPDIGRTVAGGGASGGWTVEPAQ